MFRRTEEGQPWELHEDGAWDFDKQLKRYFFRVKIRHFSDVCLGTELSLHSDCDSWVVSRGRPKKRQLEFVNATDKKIDFKVLPTGYSTSAIKSFNAGVKVPGIVGVTVGLDRESETVIMSAATAPSTFSVPPKEDAGTPKAGDVCPAHTYNIPKKMRGEARVYMYTSDRQEPWLNEVHPQRTQLVVLPPMFSGGPTPSAVDVADVQAPASTVPSEDGADGASVAQPTPEIVGVTSGGDEGGRSAAQPAPEKEQTGWGSTCVVT